MTFKKTLIAVIGTVLLASVCAVGWHQIMNDNKDDNQLVIITTGLNELNIGLESPYGVKSPQHVLLINKSSHHVLACEIVYEFIPREGEMRSSRKIVAYNRPLEEKDEVARKALLKSEPGIAPNSKILIGMGSEVDLVPISDKLPSLTSDITVDEALRYPVELQQLSIRINAVVFEDGKAFGPGAEQFLAHLYGTVLQKEKP